MRSNINNDLDELQNRLHFIRVFFCMFRICSQKKLQCIAHFFIFIHLQSFVHFFFMQLFYFIFHAARHLHRWCNCFVVFFFSCLLFFRSLFITSVFYSASFYFQIIRSLRSRSLALFLVPLLFTLNSLHLYLLQTQNGEIINNLYDKTEIEAYDVSERKLPKRQTKMSEK